MKKMEIVIGEVFVEPFATFAALISRISTSCALFMVAEYLCRHDHL